MTHSIITVDLGYGDAGKGTTVDALVRKHQTGLVVRYNGGSQCGHNVVTDDGRHHEFVQYGSGTFAGADTLLSEHVIVNPLDLVLESQALRPKMPILPTVIIDERALVTTPYHVLLNRVKELTRTKRHGSCGKGIAATVNYAAKYPEEAMRMGDLRRPLTMADKLAQISSRIVKQIHEISDEGWVNSLVEQVLHHTVADWINDYDDSLKYFRLASAEEVQELLNSEETLIFEAAQGLLLDPMYGFIPHVTKTDMTSYNANALLTENEVQGYRTELGITRTYMTRHGAGPFPTEDNSVSDTLGDVHNHHNAWQQNFRVGHLDLPALRYAIRANCGISELAVTHMDSLHLLPEWKVCYEYQTPDGKVLNLYPSGNKEEQEKLTQQLFTVRPMYMKVRRADVLGLISDSLNSPVSLISRGPAAKDKTFR